MSAWRDLREGVRQAILLQDRVERLAEGVKQIEQATRDHERRLVRIETMIEIAQQQRRLE